MSALLTMFGAFAFSGAACALVCRYAERDGGSALVWAAYPMMTGSMGLLLFMVLCRVFNIDPTP